MSENSTDEPASIAKQLLRAGTITEDEFNQIVNRDKLFRGRVDSLNAYRAEQRDLDESEEEEEKQPESVIEAQKNAEQLYKEGLINQEDFKRLSRHALMFSRVQAGANLAKKNSVQQQILSPSQRIRGWFNKLRSPTSSNMTKSKEETISETLARACRENNCEEIVNILSKHPEAVDMSSSHDFKTPLHIAAASGHFDAVRTLIKFGASLRKLDSKGHSAVDASKSRQISSFLSARCLDQKGSSSKPRAKMIRRSSSFFESTGRIFDYFCVGTFRVAKAKVEVLERVPASDHRDIPFSHLSLSNIGVFLPPGGGRCDAGMMNEWWMSRKRGLCHTFALTLKCRVIYVTALCFSSSSSSDSSTQAMYDSVESVFGLRDERVFLLFSHYPFVELSRVLLRKAHEIYVSQKNISYKDLATAMESLMSFHVPKPGEDLNIELQSPLNLKIHITRGEGPMCPIDGGDDETCGIGIPDSSSSDSSSSSSSSTCRGAFLTLFEHISPSDVCKVLGAMLQEKNVLIVSQHTHLLTPCCEGTCCLISLSFSSSNIKHQTPTALLSLLFPLKWSGIYIPNLPVSLIQMFDTPVPFLIGMHVSNKAHINRFVNPGQTYVANFVEVNLDTSTCTFTKETGILIPKPLIVQFASRVACGLIRDQTSRRDDVFVKFSSALRSFYDAHNPDRLRREPAFLPRAVALYRNHQSFLFRELSGRYKVVAEKALKQKNTLRRFTNKFTRGEREESLTFAPNGRFFVRAAGLELLYSLMGGFQVVRMIPEVAEAICVEQRTPNIVGEQFRELKMTLNGLHTNAISVAEAVKPFRGQAFQKMVLETQMYKLYAAEYTRLVQVGKPRAEEIRLFDIYADGRNDGLGWVEMAKKIVGDSHFVFSVKPSC